MSPPPPKFASDRGITAENGVDFSNRWRPKSQSHCCPQHRERCRCGGMRSALTNCLTSADTVYLTSDTLPDISNISWANGRCLHSLSSAESVCQHQRFRFGTDTPRLAPNTKNIRPKPHWIDRNGNWHHNEHTTNRQT